MEISLRLLLGSHRSVIFHFLRSSPNWPRHWNLLLEFLSTIPVDDIIVQQTCNTSWPIFWRQVPTCDKSETEIYWFTNHDICLLISYGFYRDNPRLQMHSYFGTLGNFSLKQETTFLKDNYSSIATWIVWIEITKEIDLSHWMIRFVQWALKSQKQTGSRWCWGCQS